MAQGTVEWFSDKKQYGFIESEGIQGIFFHWSSIEESGFFEIAKDHRVSFEMRQSEVGLQAFGVRVIR